MKAGRCAVGSWKTWLEDRIRGLSDDRIQRENAARIMAGGNVGWLATVGEWVYFGAGGDQLRRETDNRFPLYGRGVWVVMPPGPSSAPGDLARCAYATRAALDD